jgi:hypothetical protein
MGFEPTPAESQSAMLPVYTTATSLYLALHLRSINTE